jgi:hypothetical protein
MKKLHRHIRLAAVGAALALTTLLAQAQTGSHKAVIGKRRSGWTLTQ